MTNLAELRKSKGLSQAELSRLVGVSKVTIQTWETTNAKPNAENKRKLDEVLGVEEENNGL